MMGLSRVPPYHNPDPHLQHILNRDSVPVVLVCLVASPNAASRCLGVVPGLERLGAQRLAPPSSKTHHCPAMMTRHRTMRPQAHHPSPTRTVHTGAKELGGRTSKQLTRCQVKPASRSGLPLAASVQVSPLFSKAPSTHHHGSHVPRQVSFVPGILASDTVIGQVQAR
jgi:hypothetical protein